MMPGPGEGRGSKVKYLPHWPDRFGVYEDHCTDFQTWKTVVLGDSVHIWVTENFIKNIDYCDNDDGSWSVTERVLLLMTLKWQQAY